MHPHNPWCMLFIYICISRRYFLWSKCHFRMQLLAPRMLITKTHFIAAILLHCSSTELTTLFEKLHFQTPAMIRTQSLQKWCQTASTQGLMEGVLWPKTYCEPDLIWPNLTYFFLDTKHLLPCWPDLEPLTYSVCNSSLVKIDQNNKDTQTWRNNILHPRNTVFHLFSISNPFFKLLLTY